MDESEENRPGDRGKLKDLVAFWIFGLCNNYGYVVMLTAAEDIINSKIVSQKKEIKNLFKKIFFRLSKLIQNSSMNENAQS